ncbi:MAG TPA: dCTP deaminase [Alphaproteobacteria bacterium]|jgi:dCTP deaminase|nr:dCTP deaminase [Alphaproteobacteria bacterium]
MERVHENRPPLETVYGTLPDWAVKEHVSSGYIGIDPLSPDWEKKMGPVTMDFHMSGHIEVPKIEPHWHIDTAQKVNGNHYDVRDLEPKGAFIMQPGQFIIVATKEKLTLPNDMVGRLEGRSSLARMGLVVHLTAGRFDPGYNNNPVLELKNNGQTDIIIYEGMPICAFSFERLMASVERSYAVRGRYTGTDIKPNFDRKDLQL